MKKLRDALYPLLTLVLFQRVRPAHPGFVSSKRKISRSQNLHGGRIFYFHYFLAVYLIITISWQQTFSGSGPLKPFIFILITHTILAVAIVP